ncbi:MAG: site-specific DNA-methyltransferase [Armatimonadota bacterium]
MGFIPSRRWYLGSISPLCSYFLTVFRERRYFLATPRTNWPSRFAARRTFNTVSTVNISLGCSLHPGVLPRNGSSTRGGSVFDADYPARWVIIARRLTPQAGDHPTPKPIGLLEEIIRAAAPARGVILDPFAGSGSTLIAAERRGRTCYAAELEPRYCDTILARWEALSGSKASPMKQ